MDCTADLTDFLSRHPHIRHEFDQIFGLESHERLLDCLATYAADPAWTLEILISFHKLLPELCVRWCRLLDPTAVVAACGRIVGAVPWLINHVFTILGTVISGDGILANIAELRFESATKPSESTARVLATLIGLFRLLRAENSTFERFVDPARLASLTSHPNRCVRFLSMRGLAMYIRLSDSATEAVVEKCCGSEPINGDIDNKIIDYRFLTIFEERRLLSWSKKTQTGAGLWDQLRVESDSRKFLITNEYLSNFAVEIFGSIVPTGLARTVPDSHMQQLCMTTTTINNGKALLSALSTSMPILISGPSGCGKSALVNFLSSQMRSDAPMLTLHINEQTDAKSLIGMHVTGDTPGSFEWQPGVLTQALQEGRWVLIEDLDHVPKNIFGILAPLLKRRELRLPGRNNVLKASPQFQILGTCQHARSLQSANSKSVAGSLDMHDWKEVIFNPISDDDLRQILAWKFQNLSSMQEQLLQVYNALKYRDIPRQLQGPRVREASTRDLFKWCQRITNALQDSESSDAVHGLSEHNLDCIFLDAIDSFTGSLAGDAEQKRLDVQTIAEVMQVDPGRREYLSTVRAPDIKRRGQRVPHYVVGRSRLPIDAENQAAVPTQASPSFSLNRSTRKVMEQVGCAVRNQEPLLLVGETGIGKTSSVQYMASLLNKRLIVINLSQQSESGDLLGNFKPVTFKSIVVPLKEEFDALFSSTFSKRKNVEYAERLSKLIAHSKWKEVTRFWKHALATILNNTQKVSTSSRTNGDVYEDGPVKRRKLNNSGSWTAFSKKVDALEKRLAGSGDGFAFSFVEGELVRAVRRGDWVLLDEINLAPSDALASLSQLLESDTTSRSSLQLSEAGSVERVRAHPDFRLFAAMNPSTDIGKKELVPSIRSRFTEIFVNSPDRDRESLEDIVATYLLNASPTVHESRTCKIATDLFLKLQDEVKKSNFTDGSGSKVQYSLRSLTRALAYAKALTTTCGVLRGLYEGFCMCFCTCLNKDSERNAQQMIQKFLFNDERQAHRELSKPLRLPSTDKSFVEVGVQIVTSNIATKEFVYQDTTFSMPRGLKDPNPRNDYVVTPHVARNLNNLVRALCAGKYPVLIQGPTSAGKTSMIEYLAHRSGNDLVRINNHEHTDLQEYLGTYDSTAGGSLVFQEGVLVQALKKGSWVILDELNLAPTDVLEALNRLLDENRELLIPETQERVCPHPGFMLFATQNPAGAYGGRKQLSRAFRNRFLELHYEDFPVEELEIILSKRSQLPPSWSRQIVQVYSTLSRLRQRNRLFEQNGFATLRDLFRWALRGAGTLQDLAEDGFMLLAEKTRSSEERQFVRDVLEKDMSRKGIAVKIDEQNLYLRMSQEAAKRDRSGVVWTKAMQRMYSLMQRATDNQEPVLLVGETGCGKTRACQMLADLSETPLHSVNAHQNMETGDLIGAQRPNRSRDVLETELQSHLKQALDIVGEAKNSDNALLEYERLDAHERLAVPQVLQKKIASYLARLKTLFEWHDGSLVQAMRAGHYFLLDEISLADDSVLERINSVLDPQRSVLLAEKGTPDALVTAANGFRMFATMNPAGDYGKRELSAALRNRFTEIWIPPTNDLDDANQIVREKLHNPAKYLSQGLVEFAAWFNCDYRSSKLGAVALRDLLTWVDFINLEPTYPLKQVYEGAHLVFIDTLGANPSGGVVIDHNIAIERRHCLEHLQNIFPFPRNGYDSDESFCIGTEPFSQINDASSAKSEGSQAYLSFNFTARTTRLNAVRVLRGLRLNQPLLLEGAPGVGKTSLVCALALRIGHPIARLNLSEQTDLSDLFGSDVPVENGEIGMFTWRDAPFLSAMREGHWVLLDEMNLASQSVLEGLNACIDHRGEVFVPELGKTFSRHPSFRIFATQNPHGQGSGRKGLPTSFVNRFNVVFFDALDVTDLKSLARCNHPTVREDSVVAVVQLASNITCKLTEDPSFGVLGRPWEFNLRDISRFLQLVQFATGSEISMSLLDCADMLFGLRFRSQVDRQRVSTLAVTTFGPRDTSRSLFYNLSADSLQIGAAVLPRQSSFGNATNSSLTLNHHLLPVLECLMICVRESWPALLVGDTGTGTVEAVASLGRAVGAKVSTISMSADIDTNDLIGSFDHLDKHQDMAQNFKQTDELSAKLLLTNLFTEDEAMLSLLLRLLLTIRPSTVSSFSVRKVSEALQALIAKLQSHQNSQNTKIVDKLLELYSKCKHAGPSNISEAARFHWVDGPLIEALEEGHWLILENANLCSSSVLDRLNSLLEPDGTLIVSENCLDDGKPRVIRPHANFRVFLTMNPKHGEISRAMRNRTVELYLTPDEEDGKGSELSLSAAESRYLQLLRVCSNNSLEGIEAMHLFERLSQSDLALLPRFIEFCAHCSLLLTVHTKLIEAFQSWEVAEEKWLKLRKALHKELASGQTSNYAIHHQPVQLLLNQPWVLSQASSNMNFNRLMEFGRAFNLLIDLQSADKIISKCADVRNLSEHHNQQVFAFEIAANIQKFVSSSFEDFIENEYSPPQSLAILSKLLFVRSSLLQLMQRPQSSKIDTTLHLRIATDLLQRVQSPNQTFLRLAQEGDILPQMNGGDVSRQKSMEILWCSLRGPLLLNSQQIDAAKEMQQAADRIDSIAWVAPQLFKDIAVLKLSLSDVAKPIYNKVANSNQNVSSFESSVDVMHSIKTERSDYMAHFQPCFDLICRLRHLNLGGHPQSCSENRNHMEAEVLGLQKSKHPLILGSIHSAQTGLERLSLYAGFEEDAMATPDILQQTLSIKLHSASQSTLKQEQLVREEMKLLGQLLSTDVPSMADSFTSGLSECLQTAMIHVLQAIRSKVNIDDVDVLLSARPEIVVEAEADSRHERESSSVDQDLKQHISGVFNKYFQAIVAGATNTTNSQKSKPALSRNLIAFGIGCLELYIPSRPHDPAQISILQSELLESQLQHLHHRLESVQSLELLFTGNRDSLRSRAIKGEIKDLEPSCEMLHPARPADESLYGLHDAFHATRLLRQKLVRAYDSSMMDALAQQSILQECQHVVSLLLRTRLEHQDIIRPLIGFVQCIKVGVQIAMKVENDRNKSLAQDSLINADMTLILNPETPAHGSKSATSILDEAQKLRRLGLLTKITPHNQQLIALRVLEILDRAYVSHRHSLAEAQKAEARLSSVFEYRDKGADESKSEEEIADVLQDDTRSNTRAAIQTASSAIASACRSLFELNGSPVKELEELIMHQIQYGGALDHPANDDPTIMRTWPWLVLQLDHQQLQRSIHATSNNIYNIYTDTNVDESSKFRKIVQSAQIRLKIISETWPENLVLGNAIEKCVEIMSTPICESVARNISRAEQLHSAMDEWAKVASRDYGIAEEQQALVRLIVSWRQLELSTWARLLDLEVARAAKEADSWWFVAYENTIVATESIDAVAANAYDHVVQLLSTLEELLRNATIGQFETRLGVIQNLLGIIKMQGQLNNTFAMLARGLQNLQNHFARYLSAIRNVIQDKRLHIDREIQDVIKLASWKDTNVLALRQSSKISHNKLVRWVRKFRDALNVPCLVHLSAISSSPHVQPETYPVVGAAEDFAFDLPALSSQCLSWPSYYQHPMQTVNKMIGMSSAWGHSIHDAAQRVSELVENVSLSARKLKDATPRVATDDNAATLRHLIARKKRLLADTFKDLQVAGLRSSQSVATLDAQNSPSKAFVSMALSDSDQLEPASVALHDALDSMTKVRQVSINHSEDLSHQDVARGIGYLEALLSMCLRQRERISTCSGLLNRLSNMRNRVYHVFSARDSCRVAPRSGYDATDLCHNIVTWLPVAIAVGIHLLEAQARLSGLKSTTIIRTLQEAMTSFEGLKDRLAHAIELPEGLVSEATEQLLDEIQHGHKAFRTTLHNLISTEPTGVPTLTQLLTWTSVDIGAEHDASNQQRKDQDDERVYQRPRVGIFNAVREMLDQILVSMQDIQGFYQEAAEQDAEKDWLQRSTNLTLSTPKAHQIKNIQESLDEIASSLSWYDLKDHIKLDEAIRAIAYALPIINQYGKIIHQNLTQLRSLHQSSTKALFDLCQLFYQVAENGFCKPAETTEGRSDGTENLEGGTGLGEGEGAEDISKDIKSDEDLSELEAEQQQDNMKSTQNEDDAIGADQDIQGSSEDTSSKEQEVNENVETNGADEQQKAQEDGDVGENEEETNCSEGDDVSDENIDETVADVDDTAPSAVDEKLWNETTTSEQDQEKAGHKPGTSTKAEEQAAARDDTQEQEKQDAIPNEEATDATSEDQEDADHQEDSEAPNTPPPMQENDVDPYAQAEEALNLPEELDLNMDKGTRDDLSDLGTDDEMEENADIEHSASQSETMNEAEEQGSERDEVHDRETNDEQSNEGDQEMREAEMDVGEQNLDDNSTQAFADGALADESAGTTQGPEQSSVQAQPREHEKSFDENALKRQQLETGSGGGQDEDMEADQARTSQISKIDLQADASQSNQELDQENLKHQETIRQIGDTLEAYQRAVRPIREQASERDKNTRKEDVEMSGTEFEHLPSADATADTQALGAATQEQARQTDMSIEEPQAGSDEHEAMSGFLPEDSPESKEEQIIEDEEQTNANVEDQTNSSAPRNTTTVGQSSMTLGDDSMDTSDDKQGLGDVSQDLEEMQLDQLVSNPLTESSNLAKTWHHHELSTQALALQLTEQLRLILAPSQATKLRGDFRSGKRLNMKRIIPYIASSYKRDKIWMRRSVPSKRSYQIQLAIDDSKSMGEKRSSELAFSTLALVAGALRMLEAGEIGVVGFGTDVFVAHELSVPFLAGSGEAVMRRFGFAQTTTDVRKLIEKSIDLFRDARLKAHGSASDLWQLQFIISDGYFSDHREIRRLLMQAHEERIMFVFLVLDSMDEGDGSTGKGKKAQSIVDLMEMEIVQEPAEEEGEPPRRRVVKRKYIDTFPFRYFLLVRDVNELPNVLAAALRQWFAEVVEA